jgi:hypothetical protein
MISMPGRKSNILSLLAFTLILLLFANAVVSNNAKVYTLGDGEGSRCEEQLREYKKKDYNSGSFSLDDRKILSNAYALPCRLTQDYFAVHSPVHFSGTILHKKTKDRSPPVKL